MTYRAIVLCRLRLVKHQVVNLVKHHLMPHHENKKGGCNDAELVTVLAFFFVFHHVHFQNFQVTALFLSRVTP